MLNSNVIGNKIAAARKRNFLSQAELAQKVAISPQAVGKWERGESMPDITTLNRLAEILEVDLNYFSDSFTSLNTSKETPKTEMLNNTLGPVSNSNVNRDMSKLNLLDSDFSGLNNLHDKFASANLQRCLFVNSNLNGLTLTSNNIDACNFTNAVFTGSSFSKCNIQSCNFTAADFTKTTFRSSNFMKNTLDNVKWNNTAFIDMQIQDTIFEGFFTDCVFDNCAFYTTKFQNATLVNTFFKNNRKFKRVQFVNCKADKITYAFLKNNLADLKGVIIIPEV